MLISENLLIKATFGSISLRISVFLELGEVIKPQLFSWTQTHWLSLSLSETGEWASRANTVGWGYSSVAECLLSRHKVLGSIPTHRQDKMRREGRRFEAELCMEHVRVGLKSSLCPFPEFSVSQETELYSVNLLDFLAIYIWVGFSQWKVPEGHEIQRGKRAQEGRHDSFIHALQDFWQIVHS